MAGLDLTTLSRMKDYLGITTSSPQTDAVIGRFVQSTSGIIMAYLERDSFISRLCTDRFDGQGNQMRWPHNWPVTSITSVQVDGNNIQPFLSLDSDPIYTNSNGWKLDTWNGIPPGGQQALELEGYLFTRGLLNCQIVYTAGYLGAEPLTISGGVTQVVLQPYGLWIADNDVSLIDGPLDVVMLRVPYDSTQPPATGTYYLDPSPTVVGGYIFSPDDAGRPVIVRYSYCPYAVEQACWDVASASYMRRQHPGVRSRSLASQESVTYDSFGSSSGLSAYVLDILQPFKAAIPE
jgi:hypothetical protein